MTGLDRELLLALNRHVGSLPWLDGLAVELARNDLLKGGIAVAVLMGLWFRSGDVPDATRRRERLATTILATILLLAFNRALATWLEFRGRPLHDPDLELRLAEGLKRRSFSDLSAFPSDHAVMFAGLASGAWTVSRLAGTFLAAHAVGAVLLARVYLGIHWPSDVVVGAALGIAGVALAVRERPRSLLARPVLGLRERWPGVFAVLAFLTLFELANLFQGSVRLGYRILEIFGHDGKL